MACRNRSHAALVASIATAALAAMVVLAAGCAAARRVVPYPSARVEGLELQDVDLTSLTLRFDIEVTNPYTVELPVSGLDFALSTEGKSFFEGDTRVDSAVPAGGSKLVAVPVRVPWLDIYEAAGSIRPGDDLDLRADLGLTLRTPVAGDVRLPLEHTRTVRIPTIP